MSLVLVDCNNFFVSCERLFNPKLERRPVIILSGDGGICVARSQEAKAIGIQMGAPYFECAALCRKYDVEVLSSNFSLYLDISRRVMKTLRHFSADMEVYSVDEAFLFLETISQEKLLEIRRRLLRYVGIPVSIGAASTKTLAKVAVSLAKKRVDNLFLLEETARQAVLEKLEIEEVWGIGRKLSERLRNNKIYTALQFCQASDSWIKKNFGVVVLRSAWELRGISCFDLHEEEALKKSISTARALPEPISSFEELATILAGDTARVALKLRGQESLASYLVVMARTLDAADEAFCHLTEPTSYTPHLIERAKETLRALYKEGVSYKKVGILLGGLVPVSVRQMTLFEGALPGNRMKEEKLMQTCDAINSRMKKQALHFASEGKRPTRNAKSTPSFTTKWSDLPLCS